MFNLNNICELYIRTTVAFIGKSLRQRHISLHKLNIVQLVLQFMANISHPTEESGACRYRLGHDVSVKIQGKTVNRTIGIILQATEIGVSSELFCVNVEYVYVLRTALDGFI